MTNSELMITITELKSEIENQTHLCGNVFKLESADTRALHDIIESTDIKIDQLKQYQKILNIRNYTEIFTFNHKEITVSDLIKIKETLLLKKKLKSSLIHSSPEQEELIQISLKAFQDVQEYKKQLSEIHIILEKFNTTIFKIKDYE